MRSPLLAPCAALLLLLIACPGSDWPGAERDALMKSCEATTPASAATAAAELETCRCLFERAAKEIPWQQYKAWRAASETGAPRDKEITRRITEFAASCATALKR